MTRRLALSLTLLLLAMPRLASQDARGATPLRTQSLDVSDNLYLVSGGGGNSLMMTGDRGVVLVDTKSAGLGRALIDIAASISDQSITTLICTQSDADHTGASRELPLLTEVIAHENTKARLPQTDVTTFRDTRSIGDGRDRLDLYYFGKGHSDGDVVAVFPAKRVAYLGDLYPGKTVPIVDAAHGGSLLAWPDTLSRVVTEVKGVTKIIPGHAVPPPGSPLGRWITMADLQEYATFTRDLVAAVREAFDAGRTADEAARTLTLQGRYPAYNFDHVRETVGAAYAELSQRR